MTNLRTLFEPKSIAVIGASRNPEKIGHAIIKNLIDSHFQGRIYPVNPKAQRILGKKSFTSVLKVTQAIDCAVIAIPAELVAVALQDCGKKKIRTVIIISAGFAETGADGARREKKLRSIARRYHIQVLGPNCLGLINTFHNMNASFASGNPERGGVSFVSQSGALMVSLIDWALTANMGLSKLISLGNESGITDTDAIDYLANDPQTHVIGLYLEKLNDPIRFLRLVSRVSKKKPIIVLKAGLSEAGQKAIATHTGSLAGSQTITAAIFRQAGIIQVTEIRELFNLMKLFGQAKRNASKKTIILTNAGGPGIVAVDSMQRSGLELATIPNGLRERLRHILPDQAAIGNPIDMLGDADSIRFKKTLSLLLHERSFGNICIIITPQIMTPVMRMAKHIVNVTRKSNKQILACFIGGKAMSAAKKMLAKNHVPEFNDPSEALRTLGMSKTFFDEHAAFTKHVNIGMRGSADVRLLPYAAVMRILKKFRFPIVGSKIIGTRSRIRRVTRYPVVAKVEAANIMHKYLAGGVRLNIASRSELTRVWDEWSRRFRRDGFRGILIQPMEYEGLEIIIGMRRDPQIGFVVMVGSGGITTEVFHDTALRIGPVSLSEARTMLRELRCYRFIQTLDIEFLVSVIVKVSTLATRMPLLRELDFNPVKLRKKGGIIIDARLAVSK